MIKMAVPILNSTQKMPINTYKKFVRIRTSTRTYYTLWHVVRNLQVHVILHLFLLLKSQQKHTQPQLYIYRSSVMLPSSMFHTHSQQMQHSTAHSASRASYIYYFGIKKKYTPAVRSKNLSKLIFARLVVILRSRVLRVVCPHKGYRSAIIQPGRLLCALRTFKLIIVASELHLLLASINSSNCCFSQTVVVLATSH